MTLNAYTFSTNSMTDSIVDFGMKEKVKMQNCMVCFCKVQ